MATICDDEFMTNLTSLIDRSLCALSEDHFYFNGPDPQIMMHVWREDGFCFGGTSERSYDPGADVRANVTNDLSRAAANLPWFLNHSPERLLEIAHIESTKEACQALFGMPRVPFAKRKYTRQ